MDKSLLGKLPPELRNKIYELVLYEPEGFRIFASDGTDPDTGDYDGGHKGVRMYYLDRLRAKDALELTKVCKEIRAETVPMFYHLNTFTLCYASGSHSVAQWSPQLKTTYAKTLTACRQWLKTLPARAAGSIKCFYITHDGGKAYAPGKRATYWWKDQRRVEEELLHKLVTPSSIRVKIRLECYDRWHHMTVAQCFASNIAYSCHLDILGECSVIVYDLPVSNKARARSEVETQTEKHRVKVDDCATTYGCCVGVLQEEVLAGLDVSPTLLLNVIGK